MQPSTVHRARARQKVVIWDPVFTRQCMLKSTATGKLIRTESRPPHVNGKLKSTPSARPGGQNVIDRIEQLLRKEGFREGAVGPEASGTIESRLAATGQGDDLEVWEVAMEDTNGGQPAIGHHDIRKNQVGWLGPKQLHSLEPVDRRSDGVPRLRQHSHQRFAKRVVVIDDYNAGHASETDCWWNYSFQHRLTERKARPANYVFPP